MCSSVPTIYAIPLVLLYKAFESVGDQLKFLDKKIRLSNQKIANLAQNLNESREASRIKIEIDEQNDEDCSAREELIKLFIARGLVRAQHQMYNEAKEDIRKAVKLIESYKESDNPFTAITYLYEYLLGICDFGNNEFENAAIRFENSIDFRLQLEKHYESEQDCEQAILDLENQLLKISDGKSHKISASFKLIRGKMSDAKVKTKNYVNHGLKLNTDKTVYKNKPKTLISIESLYIRSALSYYNSNSFHQAIEKFTTAIEIGSQYKSDQLGSSYFQRGLCYYYLKDFDAALEDFTMSKKLTIISRREQIYTKRAQCFEYKGMIKEMAKDEKKVRLLNPSFKKPDLQLRFIQEDCIIYSFKFLSLRDLMILYGSSRFIRGLVQNHAKESCFRLNFHQWNFKPIPQSLAGKLFLPKDVAMDKNEIYNNLLHHTLIFDHAKLVAVPKEISNLFFNIMSNKEHVEIKELPTRPLLESFAERNPEIRSIALRISYYKSNSYDIEHLISLFPKLTVFEIYHALFKTNPFKNSKLEKIIYHENSNFYIEELKKFVGDISEYKNCKEFEKEMPNITFNEIAIKSKK